jgi:hypothetical protein
LRIRAVVLAAVLWLWLWTAAAQNNSVRTTYHVRQVASGVIYLDGGSDDGLAEGMHLAVTRLSAGEPLMNRRDIGTLVVIGVAANSAACEAKDSLAPLQPGDAAELSAGDAQVLVLVRTSKSSRSYAQVVSFTEGDPIEEELREYVPRPPLPSVNRVKGRIGFEQNGIIDHSTGLHTFQEGLVLRADMTRIGGTFWNFTGYWRGRFTSQSGAGSPATLNDLLNRTYQIGLTYTNPQSRWVAGFGRYLLPWANSLNTLDGGYLGRRVGKQFTVGLFAGSTPDPTAWNYDPNRQMAGTFVAFEHGTFEGVRFTSTAGAAITRNHWHPERQFLFFENTIQVNTKFSIYHDLETDRLAKALVTGGNNGPRLARSFLTLRYQPVKRLALDVSHNYFRDVPTFDTRLLGTGLLDKFLFQGFSGGFRLDLPAGTGVYANLGRNRQNQDTKASLNYMGGIILGRLPQFPFRVDLRYSRFNSSFGTGSYQSATISRQLGERLRFEFQAGEQRLKSAFTAQGGAHYGTASMDYLVGMHYIVGAGWTVYRGGVQNYDQMYINLGYRF